MKILFIGAGNMGGALLSRISNIKDIGSIDVVQPSLSKKLEYMAYKHISFYSSADKLPADSYQPDIVVIAIKPQQISTVIPEYTSLMKSALLVSIAAGVSAADIQTYLGNDKHDNIIRIMPNMAMEVGESMNLGYALPGCCERSKAFLEEMLKVTGKLHWLEEESKFDSLTFVTGCSPAFFYQYAAKLTEIAVQQGVKLEDAEMLAKQAFLGSAKAMREGASFQELMDAVACKGGVTEAALEAMNETLGQVVQDGFAAAMARTDELG